LLDGLDPAEVIEKTRFTFEENGDVWEVDEFMGANEGLIVAEIELASEEQAFTRPDWLGEEVSKISRYLNVELSKLPYKAWNQELKH
ncbi:MAG: adenylate cyclase, partial [Mailhella sp.]|nr:adenylate cyclase [Mailhella sp.]